MKEQNISNKETKRIRVRMIRGLDYNGDSIDGYVYDLTDNFDIVRLSRVAINAKDGHTGFIVEESYFEEGEYDNTKLGENEFHSLMEYYIGQEAKNGLMIAGHLFAKNDYTKLVSNSTELRKKIALLIYEVKKDVCLNSISNLYKNNDVQKVKVYSI